LVLEVKKMLLSTAVLAVETGKTSSTRASSSGNFTRSQKGERYFPLENPTQALPGRVYRLGWKARVTSATGTPGSSAPKGNFTHSRNRVNHLDELFSRILKRISHGGKDRKV